MMNAPLKNLSRSQAESLAGQILDVLEPASAASGGRRDDQTQPGGPVPTLMTALTELLGPAFSSPANEETAAALSRLAQALAQAFSSGSEQARSLSADMAEPSRVLSARNYAVLPDGRPVPAVSGPGAPSAAPALRTAFAARPGSAFDDSAEAGQDLEGFSDYYRRDARRYDSGFAPLT